MTVNVLAQAPGDDCCKGVKHTGEPKGTIEKIGGLDTYIATPPYLAAGQPAKGVILFYADNFGPLFINNKLIQDYFADQGFIVVGIDYFLGDPIETHLNEAGFDWPAWLSKSESQSREYEPKWYEAIKKRFGQETKYTAIGYCFGAPFVCEAGASGKMVAGAVAHPGSLDESHFRNINVPLLLSCAEEDHTFSTEFRRRAEGILVEDKKVYHLQVFGGVKHGFAVRGDPNVENERWAKEECARTTVEWFKRFSK
ncbi:alpha/beta-hydrolase [Phellopilus nigrolimitatus]|nr:alpha/beta-hydrolase [Phellopilus nigrolimitatus]